MNEIYSAIGFGILFGLGLGAAILSLRGRAQ